MASVLDNLTGPQRDAYAAVNDMLKTYGLEALAPTLLNYVQQGYSSDTISYLLQDTPAYKQRFAANDIRRKNGLPVLTPAQYIANEQAYRQIMQAAGLPKGFYDQPSDFQSFLANDVSPQEVQQRVLDAEKFVQSAPPEAKQLFSQWYSQGDMVAYALDQKKAEPLVGKQFQAAQIGGAAAQQGLDVTQQSAEQLAAQGISTQQAQQGFGMIAQDKPTLDKLAQISGQQGLTTQDLIKGTFGADSAVNKERQRLINQEQARLGGSSGTGSGALSRKAGNGI